MKYLVHKAFNGNPIGVWSESGDSYYPEPHMLQKSAQALVSTRYPEEPWEDFADRLQSRVSHRDWWDEHTSEQSDLSLVWREIVPSSGPLF